MLAVLFNTLTVLVGGTVGLLLGKAIPQHITDIIMKGIALCTIYIGISGALEGQNTLVLILSIVSGAIIGELLDLDARLNRLAQRLEKRFKKGDSKTSLAEGFITASLLFCVGAMTIVGSLQAGLNGNTEMLMTKATLDLISSCVLSAALGLGVVLAAVFVLVFQGGIVLLAGALAPLLSDYAVAEMTCAGSILIIGMGFNLLGITKLKVMNYLPAIFIPIILCLFM